MLYINETFGSFHGSGNLILDDKSSPMVGYKLVLRRDNFNGGGVIFGLSEDDAVKAAKLKTVRLQVASDKFFELVVGHYDGDQSTAAVTGLTTAEPKNL
jgi:hypothetical protein